MFCPVDGCVIVFVHLIVLFCVAAWEKVFPFDMCMCTPSAPSPSLGGVETFAVWTFLHLMVGFCFVSFGGPVSFVLFSYQIICNFIWSIAVGLVFVSLLSV